MKTKQRTISWQSQPAVRFERLENAPVPFRGAAENELDRFKDRLLLRLLTEASETSLAKALRQAASEAASLAWTTPLPLLFLPALLEEKAQAARRYAERQSKVKRRSRLHLDQAA